MDRILFPSWTLDRTGNEQPSRGPLITAEDVRDRIDEDIFKILEMWIRATSKDGSEDLT